MPIVRTNIAKESALTTDEAGIYRRVGQEFASRDFVTHSKDECVRGTVHTNTVEGFCQCGRYRHGRNERDRHVQPE